MRGVSDSVQGMSQFARSKVDVELHKSITVIYIFA